MSDLFFFIGLMASSFVGFYLGEQVEHKVAKQIITQCEKTLPRDQHCKLIAVPVTDKEKSDE
jgi:hypothetical protein